MKSFLDVVQQYKYVVLCAAISGFLSGASFSGLIATITDAIDTQLTQPYLTGLKFCVFWSGYGLFGVTSKHLIQKISQQFIFDLRVSLIQKILNCPLAQVEKMGDKVLGVLTEDIKALSVVLKEAPDILSAFAIIFCCFIICVYTSPTLSGGIVVLMAFASLFFVRPLKKIRRYREDMRQELNTIFSYIYQLNHGIKELLMNAPKRDVLLYERIYPACRRYKQQNIQTNLIENIPQHLGDLFLLLSIGLAIFFLPQISNVTFQEIEKFLLLFLFSLPSLKRTLRAPHLFQTAKVALTQIESLELSIDLVKKAKTTHHQYNDSRFDDGFKYLSLDKLIYNYQQLDHAFTLGPISLEFLKPEIVFITGGNGSGKSTLVKLLCGLYPPNLGQLKYNGHTVSDADQDAYRKCFSVLFADGFLSQDLLVPEGEYSDAVFRKWNKYLELLELDHKVKIENGRFSTVQLSVGQKKRLSLLVTLMDNPEIYIFDEWAANQDVTFKQFFYYQLLPELKSQGKLVLVISHDDSYFDIADRVIKLENGLVTSDTLIL